MAHTIFLLDGIVLAPHEVILFLRVIIIIFFLACYFFDYPNKPPFMQSTISILRWPKQTTNQLIHQPKGPSKQNGQAFCIAEVTVKQASYSSSFLTSSWPSLTLSAPQIPQEVAAPMGNHSLWQGSFVHVTQRLLQGLTLLSFWNT